MIIFIPFLLFLTNFSLEDLAPLSAALQQWCLDRVEAKARSSAEIYSALLCGKKLSYQSHIREVFEGAGLIHLMVVSGAHLIFLEKLWKPIPRFKFKNWCIAASLILYALMAGLYPPVVRALAGFVLARICRQWKLFWSPYWRVILSGVICLIISPSWISSISLQMSLIGALAFSYSCYSKFLGNAMCYTLLLPILSQWTLLHPASVFINWAFFPLISITLFPLSVLSFIFPFLYNAVNPLWSFLIKILGRLEIFLKHPPFYIPPLNPHWIWAYIAIIFFVSQCLWITLRRLRK